MQMLIESIENRKSINLNLNLIYSLLDGKKGTISKNAPQKNYLLAIICA